MICRAKFCLNEAMPSGLCGYHDEMAEDRIKFPQKMGRTPKERTRQPAPEEGLCTATTNKGKPCRNYAEPGAELCALHLAVLNDLANQ